MGSGWLGRPLSCHLLDRGYNVKVSTTSENRVDELASQNLQPCIVDIENLSGSIQEFLQAGTLIVNIPSRNLDGYKTLIKEIEKSPVKNLILISSTSVYDDTNSTVTESDASQSSVWFTIESFFQASNKFQTTVVRFGGLIGYSRSPGRFFKPGRSVAGPEANVNLIHRDDCIGIIEKILEEKAWGEVFNGCADTHPTKKEFYSYAALSIGMAAPAFSESGETQYKIVSNNKVKEVLGYRFIHPDLMKIQFE